MSLGVGAHMWSVMKATSTKKSGKTMRCAAFSRNLAGLGKRDQKYCRGWRAWLKTVEGR